MKNKENIENKTEKLKKLKKMLLIGGMITAGATSLYGCSKNDNNKQDVNAKSISTEITTQEDIISGDQTPIATINYMESVLDAYNSKSNKEPISMDDLGIIKSDETPYIYKKDDGSYYLNPTITSATASFEGIANTKDLYILVDNKTNTPISSLCKINDSIKNVIVECLVTDQNEITIYNDRSYINVTDHLEEVYSYFEEYYMQRLNKLNQQTRSK